MSGKAVTNKRITNKRFEWETKKKYILGIFFVRVCASS